jgi:hypothetical protein
MGKAESRQVFVGNFWVLHVLVLGLRAWVLVWRLRGLDFGHQILKMHDWGLEIRGRGRCGWSLVEVGGLGKLHIEAWGMFDRAWRHVHIYTIKAASLQENSFYFVAKACGVRR